MTVQDLGMDPVTNYFDRIFTTNSKFDRYSIPSGKHTSPSGEPPTNLEIINRPSVYIKTNTLQ